jgi:hypothetical protein
MNMSASCIRRLLTSKFHLLQHNMEGPSDQNEAPKILLHQVNHPDMRRQSDDWTGVSGTAERKKRQNRLNQRAYRRRERHRQKQTARDDENDIVVNQQTTGDTGTAGPWWVEPGNPKMAQVQALLRRLHQGYNPTMPDPSYLPVVIRWNALNALVFNAMSLGIELGELYREDAMSPFHCYGPSPVDPASRLQLCQGNLHPTALQFTVAHHPWIDIFPAAEMRDTMLRALVAGCLDEDQLCSDLLSNEVYGSTDGAYLVVWGDPGQVANWEASKLFLNKWGWLLQTCPEMLKATNRWRRRRGESRLNFGFT